jgi:hypothetical protein
MGLESGAAAGGPDVKARTLFEAKTVMTDGRSLGARDDAEGGAASVA